MSWLQNCIVWEPVDGQYIVATCHLVKEDYKGEWPWRYITKVTPSTRQESSCSTSHKCISKLSWGSMWRNFYTTLYEDMVSLCAIWISCGKPNLEICADDARRKDAVTMVSSTLHMTVLCVGRSFILGSLYKWMLEYTRHAWHEDEACYKMAL